ncbi:MAG: hypothetical protein WCF67_05635 [Chitinophagaceae bacterium]
MTTVKGHQDWNDFIYQKLTSNNDFSFLGAHTKGETNIEVYTSIKHHPETYIEVGYISPGALIFINILNPSTPGNNQQQYSGYFSRYDFYPGDEAGPAGLDFDETNIAAIGKLLSTGFHGEEKVYYKNGKPVKSELTTEFFFDNAMNTKVHWFNDNRSEEYDEAVVIDLETIFGGVK